MDPNNNVIKRLCGVLALEWQKFYSFELEYLWDQLASLYQIVCVASLGLGKGWGKSACFEGDWIKTLVSMAAENPPLTYNGDNGVSGFYPILFKLASNKDMHKISDKFKFWPDWTSYHELAVLECKNFPVDLKWASSFIFDIIIIKVAGNQDRHKRSVKFGFGLNQLTQFGVTVFNLITTHTPISAQSSNSIVFRLQPVYFMSTSL